MCSWIALGECLGALDLFNISLAARLKSGFSYLFSSNDERDVERRLLVHRSQSILQAFAICGTGSVMFLSVVISEYSILYDIRTPRLTFGSLLI